MIAIKLNTYSDEEKQVLFDLLEETLTMFETAYCPFNNPNNVIKCPNCKLKNVCYDVNKIHEYMSQIIEELGDKNDYV